MSFTVWVFLLSVFSTDLSYAQRTWCSDQDSCEDSNSNFEYIRESLEKVHQSLEQQNCSPNGPKTASNRENCEDANSTFVDIRRSLEKTNQLLERLVNQNRSATGNKCPPGFDYDAAAVSKCYSVVTQRLTRGQAQARCRQLHPKAHLVSIGSALENQLLQEILDGYDCTGTARAPDNSDHDVNNFWTSGKRKTNDCSSPFHWEPSDRFTQALGYTNWCDGEPNCYFPQEYCLALARVHCSGFRWNDMICSWPLCSVCEMARFG